MEWNERSPVEFSSDVKLPQFTVERVVTDKCEESSLIGIELAFKNKIKTAALSITPLFCTRFDKMKEIPKKIHLKSEHDTVNNKKTHPPCFSIFRFSRIYPDPLDLQKIFLHPFLKRFQLEQEFFTFGDKIS